jgi:hypothetical protein
MRQYKRKRGNLECYAVVEKKKIFETEPGEENGKRLARRFKTGSP